MPPCLHCRRATPLDPLATNLAQRSRTSPIEPQVRQSLRCRSYQIRRELRRLTVAADASRKVRAFAMDGASVPALVLAAVPVNAALCGRWRQCADRRCCRRTSQSDRNGQRVAAASRMRTDRESSPARARPSSQRCRFRPSLLPWRRRPSERTFRQRAMTCSQRARRSRCRGQRSYLPDSSGRRSISQSASQDARDGDGLLDVTDVPEVG
jgi:hypothetical protein